MAEQTPNNEPIRETQEPFIPPSLLLILAGVGLFVAVVVALTQPAFTVVGYGGLALTVASLVLWVLLAPGEARAALTGRTVRYGGTSLLVTVLVIVALVAVYTVVRNMELRVDLTQRNDFSLTDQSRAAIVGIGVDPNIPNIKMLAFYGPAQSGQRDSDSVLFDDYVAASNGKISYEFINPDQNPELAAQYQIFRYGQIVVVAEGEDGTPDVENAEVVGTLDQGQLTNAILKVAAQGVFQGLFLTVQDNTSTQMTVLKQLMTTRFDWVTRDVSLLSLNSPEGNIVLNDPNVDGQVVVIPGGSQPLSDAELEILTNYLNAGGDLVIFAGTNLNADRTALATAENLNNYLFDNFGIRINPDLVIDHTQRFQNELQPVATTFDSTSFITNNSITRTQAAAAFELAHSITIANTPPENVTITSLIRSSAGAYAKTDVEPLLANQDPNARQQLLAQAENDPVGPFVLAASAENTQTGAKVVVFGSTAIADDFYANTNASNLPLAVNSLIWTTNFDQFASTINVQQAQRPQDTPIFAEANELRSISFVTFVVLPFGVLAIGILVWWSNRERARNR
jgi:ABC-type uncharacterized transport system involved in gliding motility auxiliary subunit